MKKLILLLALMSSLITQAQVAVGTSTATMNASAQLEVTSNTKGFLPPRMTQAQRDSIVVTTASAGLMIWCTNCSSTGALSIYNGTEWTSLYKVVPPTVTTTALSNQLAVGVTSGGNVTSDGGGVSSRGVCWSTSQNPTIDNNKVTDQGVLGTYTSTITELIPSTTYYIRAFATNVSGTGYGIERSFTTPDTLPIGSTYGGGKVAYVLQSGDPGFVQGEIHGLIVANGVQSSTFIRWDQSSSYNNMLTTGATDTAIGSGLANTNLIILTINYTLYNYSYGYAAKVARDYRGGGYSDWFLPSINELYKVYLTRSLTGPYGPTSYWSSTEVSNYQVKIISGWSSANSSSAISTQTKSLGVPYVIPIRAF